jgi:hypothetical protein
VRTANLIGDEPEVLDVLCYQHAGFRMRNRKQFGVRCGPHPRALHHGFDIVPAAAELLGQGTRPHLV